MPQHDDDFEARVAHLQNELHTHLDRDPAAAIAKLDAMDGSEFGKVNASGVNIALVGRWYVVPADGSLP